MFARTTCACSECVACCKTQPGSLVVGDFERIAAHLREPREFALRWFVASPGALLGNLRTGRTFRVGTITPDYQNGRCVFLDEHDRCKIHTVAPAGCALFDTHMGAAEGQRRGQWMVKYQQDSGYQALRSLLPPATHYKPKGY